MVAPAPAPAVAPPTFRVGDLVAPADLTRDEAVRGGLDDAPAMIERRSIFFVLEGASTKLVDDLAKAAAAARADAILGRAGIVRRSSSIGEETEVAA